MAWVPTTSLRFFDLQRVARLVDSLARADIHLLPQRADVAGLVMPSKLTGMLVSARLVVAAARAGTELADVVSSCNLVVPPEDPGTMMEAIVMLAARPELRAGLGAVSRAHALKHMHREAVLLGFEAMLLAGAGAGTGGVVDGAHS